MSCGSVWNLYYRSRRCVRKAAARARTIGNVLGELFGCCAVAHAGGICPATFPLRRRVGAGTGTGPRRAFGRQFGGLLLAELDEFGILKPDELFLDATFVPAKKGEKKSAKPSGVRG